MRALGSMAILALVSCLLGCGNGTGSPKQQDPPVPVADSAGSKTTEPQAQPPEKAKSGRTGPFEKEFDRVRFSVPAGWQEVELSPRQRGFIEARFRIPAGDETLQCTATSAAGGIEANIRRWKNQFQIPTGEKPHVETISLNGTQVHWIDLRGTYRTQLGPQAGTHENWRMLGAGIPLNGEAFYLKLVGPQAAVDQVVEEFREFVESAELTGQ